MHAIGSSEVKGETPVKPTIINRLSIIPVTPGHNPYGEMMNYAKPMVVPSTIPANELNREVTKPRSGS
jgi:hypothetical protein